MRPEAGYLLMRFSRSLHLWNITMRASLWNYNTRFSRVWHKAPPTLVKMSLYYHGYNNNISLVLRRKLGSKSDSNSSLLLLNKTQKPKIIRLVYIFNTYSNIVFARRKCCTPSSSLYPSRAMPLMQYIFLGIRPPMLSSSLVRELLGAGGTMTPMSWRLCNGRRAAVGQELM
jgi:hypothetical protein